LFIEKKLINAKVEFYAFIIVINMKSDSCNQDNYMLFGLIFIS